ncbi:HlyD family secretion protein [Novosphingobium album (ex Hu et al. 2023)]|uniref:HlyD family secretion protein n=1 Tax=Novosphingobium album (ex Hu et al. 2023) TaxID=2930093 RepID=A0ABT0B7F0_9SPHN|nr:HlyD family efflux transporter periplasmic adaptor subunit [Novosphingobium album (ex Hu et al. 2023)]MCJ2181000.1 HlyD family secretion protein [Novosphingobium album (ex Hu et al. 2023)]
MAIFLVAAGTLGFAPYVLNDISTQAAINAPLIHLTAATDGTVAALPDAGQYFARPQTIKLLDLSEDTGDVAELNAQAEIAQSQIALAQRQLAELDGQSAHLASRTTRFSNAMSTRLGDDLDAARGALSACKADRAQQIATLERTRRLAAQGFVSNAGLEKAEAAVAMKAGECASAEAQTRSLGITAQAAQGGIFIANGYNDAPYAVQQADRVMLQRQMVEKALNDATAQYRQAKQRLQDAQARASYRAPAGTLVWSLGSSPGTSIRAGEPVIDLVDCRRRFVQVALPENKAEVIGPGSSADVRLIGSDDWMKGRVINITGAAGRREETLLAANTYSMPGDREIMVEVALPAPATDKLDPSRKCDVGRLAEVRFSRTS